MAVNKSKRTIPSAQTRQPAERRRLNLRLKSRAYEVLHDLHHGFETTHSSLERLERLDIVPRDHLRPCRYMAEELRALTYSALLIVLRDAESHDAAHYEKLRLAFAQRSYPKSSKSKPTTRANKLQGAGQRKQN